MLSKLGKGDEVITRGGVIGKITGISDDGVLVLELQEGRHQRLRDVSATVNAKPPGARLRWDCRENHRCHLKGLLLICLATSLFSVY